MALDDREKLFIPAYIKYGEAYPAALEAGYKHHTAKFAYEWLLETLPNTTAKRHLPYKPEVAAAIQTEMDKLKSDTIADAEEVLEYLTAVMRKKSKSSVLARRDDGSEAVIEKPPDEKESLKAAELLGKRYGLYTEKIEADVDTELTINIKRV